MINVKKLKHNPQLIKDSLVIRKEMLVTKTGCKIYIPKRFLEKKLGSIGSKTEVVGVFGIVVGDSYAMNNVPAMMTLEPDTTVSVTIVDEEYMEFGFEPNSVICPNINLVQRNSVLYNLWDELISKARVPWYINYRNLSRIYENAKKYGGDGLGANIQVMEMIIAVIARNPEKLNEQFRLAVENMLDLETKEPTLIKMTNVSLGATNTTAKLIGGYFDEGINSALLEPSKKKEPIEELLRM